MKESQVAKAKTKSKTTSNKSLKKPSEKKAKYGRTFVAVLLDETASMLGVKAETIDGYNAYKNTLRDEGKGEILFTFVKFNSMKTERVHDRIPIHRVPDLNALTYVPNHWTPLLDAIGNTVMSIDPQVIPGDKVIFVIQTDGQENSSHIYTKQRIKQMIEERIPRNWEFIFMGAEIDAYSEAASYGIGAGQTVFYNKVATKDVFGLVASSAVSLTSGMRSTNQATFSAEEKTKVENKS